MLEPDSILERRYRVTGVVNRQNQSVLYHGFELASDQEVAIKEIDITGWNARRIAKFLNQLFAWKTVDRPPFLKVDSIHKVGDKIYIITPWMPGESLQDQIRQAQISPNDFIRTIIHLIKQLNRSTNFYLNLKPANIVFDQFGEPYLTDCYDIDVQKSNRLEQLFSFFGVWFVRFIGNRLGRGAEVLSSAPAIRERLMRELDLTARDALFSNFEYETRSLSSDDPLKQFFDAVRGIEPEPAPKPEKKEPTEAVVDKEITVNSQVGTLDWNPPFPGISSPPKDNPPAKPKTPPLELPETVLPRLNRRFLMLLMLMSCIICLSMVAIYQWSLIFPPATIDTPTPAPQSYEIVKLYAVQPTDVLGEILVSYPLWMRPGNSDQVKILIQLPQEVQDALVSSANRVDIPATATPIVGKSSIHRSSIIIDDRMRVELASITLDVQPRTASIQEINIREVGQASEWIFSIKAPADLGYHLLDVSVFLDENSDSPSWIGSYQIEVLEPTSTPQPTSAPTFTATLPASPTPIPTPTPTPSFCESILIQIRDEPMDGISWLLGGLGVIALGFWKLVLPNLQRKDSINRLEDELKILKRKGAPKDARYGIEVKIARLRSIRWWEFWRETDIKDDK